MTRITGNAGSRCCRVVCAAVAVLVGSVGIASAQDAQPSGSEAGDHADGPLNLASPTMGGTQLWTDELVLHEWRIQRNALTSHYRLLDEKSIRRGWGSFEHCREELETRTKGLPPLKSRVVLVLHGLGRTRQSMDAMCERLREQADFTVLNIGYASTREPLSQHAASLSRIIQRMHGVEEISFVAHSMGNLVIRRYLADRARDGTGLQGLPRLQRVVMIAPPNQGAQLAERFRNSKLLQTVWGASGSAIAEEWDALQQTLITPPCEFGIIAGGTGRDAGRNPLLDGDDDLVVSVAETRLAGATDFVVVPAMHTWIMDQPDVQEYTRRFLQYGYFISEDKRCPIAPDEDDVPAP